VAKVVKDNTKVINAVDTILKAYPETLTRKHLAELLNVAYQYVPKKILAMKLPHTGEEGTWKRLTVLKSVFRTYLISENAAKPMRQITNKPL